MTEKSPRKSGQKTVAAKSLKEKRADKKSKSDAKSGGNSIDLSKR